MVEKAHGAWLWEEEQEGKGMRKGIPGEDHCGFARTEQGLGKIIMRTMKIIIITIHSIVGSSSRVVSCEYLFAFSKKANQIKKNIYAMSFARSSQH
jgi:hypothetical protein